VVRKSAKGQKRTYARLIAKIVAPYANRLRLLQWFWRFQLFATHRLTTDRDTESCKYRICPRKEFAADDLNRFFSDEFRNSCSAIPHEKPVSPPVVGWFVFLTMLQSCRVELPHLVVTR
jgi:hypothetical protein